MLTSNQYMTRDQYKMLNRIRTRTDREKREPMTFNAYNYAFLEKKNLIDDFVITFTGRVALAAYEGKNVDARSI